MYKILNDAHQWRVSVSIFFEVEIDADLGINGLCFPMDQRVLMKQMSIDLS